MIKVEDLLGFNAKQMKTLEDFIIDRIEDVIFNRKRPSGRKKVKGYKTKTVNGKTERTPIFKNSDVIEDGKTKQLRKTLKANKGFMRIDKKGLVFDIKMVSYYKYLDDERRTELNWFLNEAIFEDKQLSDKIAEITLEGIKGKFLEIISKAAKQT